MAKTQVKMPKLPPKPVDNEGKKKALREAMKQIETEYGKGSIMLLGEQPPQMVEALPTGALNLDMALGVGGFPRGRIVEIYGMESSGKTTLALETIAQTQKNGGIAAFIDAEHALDVYYARNLGVDVDQLVLSQPDDAEQALSICESLVRSNACDIVVLDSVAALVPRAEVLGNMGDTHVGLIARLMSQALRRITPVVSASNTTVIFLNQMRQNINPYGPKEVTPGGVALKFYSSVRLAVRRADAIKEKDQVIGNRTVVRIVKNKVAPPFKTVEFDIMYGTGISKTAVLMETGLDCDIVRRSGAWFYFGEMKLGQGKENSKLFLDENPDIREELESQVKAKLADPSFAANTKADSGTRAIDDEDLFTSDEE